MILRVRRADGVTREELSNLGPLPNRVGRNSATRQDKDAGPVTDATTVPDRLRGKRQAKTSSRIPPAYGSWQPYQTHEPTPPSLFLPRPSVSRYAPIYPTISPPVINRLASTASALFPSVNDSTSPYAVPVLPPPVFRGGVVSEYRQNFRAAQRCAPGVPNTDPGKADERRQRRGCMGLTRTRKGSVQWQCMGRRRNTEGSAASSGRNEIV